MKYIALAALALMLGACAHECNCAELEPMAAETVEAIEMEVEEPVVEEVVVEEAAPVVEEIETVVEVESAPVETTTVETTETVVVGTEGSTGRRVVTRRLVETHDAGTPTAPAIDGSAATDALLSETPRVLEEETFETTGTQTTVTTVVDEAVDAGEDAVEDAVEEAVDAVDGE